MQLEYVYYVEIFEKHMLLQYLEMTCLIILENKYITSSILHRFSIILLFQL